ncbi:MAG: thiamine pyrophosphate-dependent enzyme, partial [Quisquiliibacterium sp.]
MLTEQVSAQDTGAFTPVRAAPPPAQLAQVREMLENAQRPIVIVGGSGWNPQGVRDLQTFASDNALPVGCAFRFQDLFDNNHPNYVGDVGIGINPKLAARIRESDLVLAIGPRLGEMTTSGYTLFGIPVPSQPMVHVHSGAEELGRVYQAAVMINSGMPEIAAALAAIKVDSSAWRDQLAPARADYEAWQQRPPAMQKLSPALDLWEVVQILRAKLPVDSVITNGAGNFATWAHRFWRYAPLSDHPQGQTRSQLAPTSGAMGAGVPSAIAAKIAQPDRSVVCFAGDGDFLMTGQELATAAQYQAGVVVVLFDNGMYGTIRMHQEREYPARVLGSELANPDFARFCEAFGGLGLRVESTAQVGPALDKALEFTRRENRPALIHMKVDPEAITPNLTLSQVREGAGKR